MRILLTLLLSLFSQSTEPYKQQLDLVLMLRDTQKLQKLSIMYDSPTPHGFRLLFVRGDGSLILQSYPGRPMATNDVPTCEGKVDQDKVKELVSLIIGKHFWDLPEKRFLFINGPPSHAEFELHRIFISNGIERAVRDFGVGPMRGNRNRFQMTLLLLSCTFRNLQNLLSRISLATLRQRWSSDPHPR